jgi:hypothetical protein
MGSTKAQPIPIGRTLPSQTVKAMVGNTIDMTPFRIPGLAVVGLVIHHEAATALTFAQASGIDGPDHRYLIHR